MGGPTGADLNAGGAGDLFAALMAAMFNPAQAAQAALTPTGDTATDASGGQPAKTGEGLSRRDLGVIELNGPLGKDAKGLSSRRDENGEFIRLTAQKSFAEVLPGQEAKAGEAGKAKAGETVKPAKPAADPAATSQAEGLPRALLAQADVVSVKGHVASEPRTTPQPPAPAHATLIAAQTQAAPPQAAPAPAKAKAEAAAAPADKIAPAKTAKTSAPDAKATAAQTRSDTVAPAEEREHAELAEAEPRPSQDDLLASSGQGPAAQRAETAHGLQAHAVRGSPQTVAHLSAEIARKLEAQTTRFQVELQPAGLGKVEVKIEIGATGAIAAALNCDNAQAADALRARSGELQQALAQAGFDLSGGLSFAAGGSDHRQAQQEGRAVPGFADTLAVAAATDEPKPLASYQGARAGPGRVDVRI